MTALKRHSPLSAAAYSGSKTKAGNSEALRFEKSFFRSNPEFSGSVIARVIAPGQILVTALVDEECPDEDDPIIDAFLAFVANDIKRGNRVSAMPESLFQEMEELVGDIEVDFDEDLGEESFL
jgi:prlF antitoxin for toxin YhaV_toxin